MTIREKAVREAGKWIGVKEHPAGSNHGPVIDIWCKRCVGVAGGFPWCAAFQWCMFKNVGYHVTASQPALVQSWVQWAASHGFIVARPRRGDVVCFDWNEDGTRDHIGIVERTLALRWRGTKFVGWIQTVEGNTGATNQSNGGEVQRRRRWVNKATVFIRIPD